MKLSHVFSLAILFAFLGFSASASAKNVNARFTIPEGFEKLTKEQVDDLFPGQTPNLLAASNESRNTTFFAEGTRIPEPEPTIERIFEKMPSMVSARVPDPLLISHTYMSINGVRWAYIEFKSSDPSDVRYNILILTVHEGRFFRVHVASTIEEFNIHEESIRKCLSEIELSS
mgnify:CR=1 FL=1